MGRLESNVKFLVLEKWLRGFAREKGIRREGEEPGSGGGAWSALRDRETDG